MACNIMVRIGKIASVLSCIVLVLLLSADVVRAESQKIAFVAEVGRLMDIIINSLYSQKEIFLRELISNASDALNKIRLMAITDPDILGEETELEIKIQYDSGRKVLEIADNGIGMTKHELINNLGTVAKSGTTNFLESLHSGDINLIGQFGVGFYSAFLVAYRVQVISKSNTDAQHKWISEASNSFTVEDDDSVPLKRGTIVRLHLKDDASEFSEYDELEKLIKRYSGFISYPIYLQKKVTTEEKVEKTEAEIETEIEKVTQEWKAAGKEVNEEEIENSINRTIVRPVETVKFERVNEHKPLWIRKKDEIKKQEYRDFYKALFKETSDPLTWTHFKAEGEVDFTALMFVPERASYDQFDKFYEKKSEVKLFVRRVLVNDEFEDLLPKYLNFVKCLVDSDSLSLNVGRQTLHEDKTLKVIGNKLAKKAVDMLVAFNPTEEDEEELFSEEEEDEKDETFKSAYDKKVDTFNKFWKNFAKNIRLGMIDDRNNREKLALLTRWYTTHNISELTSLDGIVSRMKEGQKNIYFLGGESKEVLQHSPLIERLVKEGYQVILGDDPLDETIFRHFKNYKDFKIVNVARNDFKEPYKTDDLRKEQKYMKKVFQPLIDYALKELKDYIKDVKISLRLVDSPVAIVSDLNNDTPNRERLDSATSMKGNGRSPDKNILEINPHAPVIQELNKIVEDEPDEKSAKLIMNLYYAALIHSGYIVRDPQYFSENVFGLINTAFQVHEEIEEIIVTEEDLETLDPPEEPKESAPGQAEVKAEEQFDLTGDNVKVVGGGDIPNGESRNGEKGEEQLLQL